MNNSTAVSNVIPFSFGKQQVRTILIGDQPWFVAADVCGALAVINTARALSRLDEDEKGIHSMNTLGGAQNLSTVSESGLYSLILTSRKAEAKRFKKWVTSEVLPAIRKHGRYEEPAGKMASLINDLFLTPAHQRHVLDRVAELAGRDRKKYPTVWRSIKSHFKVASYKQIPDSQYSALCEFMMCKPLDGQYLPKQEDGMLQITEQQAVNLSHLLHSVAWVNHKWHQGICQGLQYLNRDMYAGTFEHFDNMRRAAIKLDASLKDLLEDIDQRHKLGGRRPEEMSIAA